MSVLIVMHCPSIQHYYRVFGNKLPIIGKVFRGNMRSAEPERIVAPLSFLHDGMDIRKICLIFHGRKPITSNNAVELFLSSFLNVGVGWNQC